MAANSKQPIPIDRELRTHLPTSEAAIHLHREVQTLRTWVSCRNAPIRPIKVHGRLMWPTDAIRAVLGVELAA